MIVITNDRSEKNLSWLLNFRVCVLLKSPVTALPLSSRLGCMYWTVDQPVLSECPLLMSKGSVWSLLIRKSLSSAWSGSSTVTQNFHDPWTMNKSTTVPAKHKHTMTAQMTLHENVAMRILQERMTCCTENVNQMYTTMKNISPPSFHKAPYSKHSKSRKYTVYDFINCK